MKRIEAMLSPHLPNGILAHYRLAPPHPYNFFQVALTHCQNLFTLLGGERHCGQQAEPDGLIQRLLY